MTIEEEWDSKKMAEVFRDMFTILSRIESNEVAITSAIGDARSSYPLRQALEETRKKITAILL
jgi:hypothetical protein